METFQKQSIGIVLKNECPGNFEKFAGKHLPRRFFKTSFWETCKQSFLSLRLFLIKWQILYTKRPSNQCMMHYIYHNAWFDDYLNQWSYPFYKKNLKESWNKAQCRSDHTTKPKFNVFKLFMSKTENFFCLKFWFVLATFHYLQNNCITPKWTLTSNHMIAFA